MKKGITNFLVKTDGALNDLITTASGVVLHKAAHINFEWNATVTGNVKILPKQKMGIKINDEVAFSYLVCSDRGFEVKTADVFKEINGAVSKDSFFMEWANGKGEILRKTKNPFTGLFAGTLLDNDGNCLSRHVGKEDEVEGWMQQFDFVDRSKYYHKNLVQVDGKDLWVVGTDKMIAKKVGDEIIPVNGYVILEPIDEDKTKSFELAAGIVLPKNYAIARYTDRGKVIGVREGFGVKKGDKIAIDGRFIEKYELWGKNYFLIQEKRVLGKIIK